MDARLIAEKSESLRRCVARVRATCPATAGALATDVDAQDIVSLNLTRAVQLAVDIASHLLAGLDVPVPHTMGETFDRLAQAGVIDEDLARRMRAAVGFRNLAVHSYARIDWEIVHALCTSRLDDFATFVAAVAGD
ncbi:type VII toxin-antitoxin system HepT family RNase toxin [Coralloluteibacterium thermophilus]|uniref:DUF86 domain-containing protein n=1 Tax=Coralloluteibacterium thermophilum TaxID=2707049 RepID=A0ABV9NMI4_9GAMM